MSTPDIYRYLDFRAWLADWQAARQSKEPEFTKTKVSHLLGLPKTRGYFSDVIGGKRVSDTFLERFCELLDLAHHEERYFRCLVRFDQAETPEEKELSLEQLHSQNRTGCTELDPSVWAYYRHWRHGAIRALLDTKDLDEAALPKAAARMHASITPKLAMESLSLLRDLGLVAVDSEGRWKPVEQSISSPAWAKDEVFRLLQAQQLEVVRTALVRPGDGRRAVATNIVAISSPALDQLRRSLDRFRQEIRSIIRLDDAPAEHVVLVANIIQPVEEGSP